MTKYRVIYVDDEENLLDLGKRFLEKDPEIKVFTTNSPQEVLRIVMKNNLYDIVISDYQMEEMDGIELLKNIRSDQEKLPFIVFTGKDREEILIEAIKNQASFYLQKGGDVKSQYAELIHKIKQAVDKNRLENGILRIQEALSMSIRGDPIEKTMEFILKSMNEIILLEYSCVKLIYDKDYLFIDSGDDDFSIRENDLFLNELSSVIPLSQRSYIAFEKFHQQETSSVILVAPIMYQEKLIGNLYAVSLEYPHFTKGMINVVNLVTAFITATLIMANKSSSF